MSDPREAGKLLGGHAAGILTEAERARLFAAALEDQALFDALADEEALRELLADPAARARLLQALQPRPARPFWRRPGTLALAAGLIGAAWIGLLRKPAKELADRQAVSELAAPPQPQAKAAPKVLAEPAPAPTRRRAKAPADKPERTFGYGSPAAGAVEGGEPAPAPVPGMDEAARQKKQADRTVQLAPGVAAAPPPPPPPPPPAGAQGRASNEAQTHLAGTSVMVVAPSGGVTDADHPPTWTFTSPGVLRVAWGPYGSTYLLRRGAKGATLLRPAAKRTQTDGQREDTYQVPTDGSTLDLYWLPWEPGHPELLPPKAPSGGTWTRIR